MIDESDRFECVIEDSETVDVAVFHRKFGIPGYGKPTTLVGEMAEFRAKFLQEELNEFIEATEAGDLVGAFDALLDLVWIAKGTADVMGIDGQQWHEGWNAVYDANISKVRATSEAQSKRKSKLDIVKPEGWVGPEAKLKAILAIKI